MEWLKLAFCLGGLVVLIEVQGSSAIKCYSCSDIKDKDAACKDPFEKNGAIKQMDCGSTVDTCAKGKMKDDKGLVRECGVAGGKAECTESGDTVTCLCKGNLCNGSTTVTASVSLLAALVLGLGVLTRM